MREQDVDAFFARRADLDPDAYVEVDISFECVGDPRVAAARLCREQSTAQWHRVGVHEDFRPRFATRVVQLEATVHAEFSLPVDEHPTGGVHRCQATLAHPHENFGPRIPNLLAAICGEGLFFTPGVPIVRLDDLRCPDVFLAAFQGPQFGVDGIREQLQAFGRPIFMGVIKPNIGLPPEPFADLGFEGWRGGLDIAKDDELLADPHWCPLARRASALGDARRRAEAITGVPKGYLANITDEVDRLAELHDVAVAAGATAVLLNAMPVGLSGARMLRRHARVPMVAHFPMIAAFSRRPEFGVHSRVITKLQRLAGFDAIIMPGFGARMMTSAAEVVACVEACLSPMGHLKPSLPVPGGSDSAETLPDIHRRLHSVDFGFVAGRGVFGHPDGPAAGATSIRQAWDAIAAGTTPAQHAITHRELRRALETFGATSVTSAERTTLA